jgi:hypothetical protein
VTTALSVSVAAGGISPAAVRAAWMLAGVRSMAPTTRSQTVVVVLLVASLIAQEDGRGVLRYVPRSPLWLRRMMSIIFRLITAKRQACQGRNVRRNRVVRLAW